MKRDMDLLRLVLLEIEEKYRCTALVNLAINGYSVESVVYHCQLAYDAGYVASCDVHYADGSVYWFSVGPLTWEGNDYLDKIRDGSRWEKIKKAASEKGLPLVAETVGTISTAAITAVAEGATSSFLKHYGLI